MKKVICILVLSLFLFNCSKSDDDNSSATFLEKYDGTVWYSDDDGMYYRIVNNLNNPREIYWSNIDCYNYISFEFDPFTTIDSNDTTFQYTIHFPGEGGPFDVTTLTVTGNSLKVETKFFEDVGVLDYSITFNFTKSSVDVDSLIKCEY